MTVVGPPSPIAARPGTAVKASRLTREEQVSGSGPLVCTPFSVCGLISGGEAALGRAVSVIWMIKNRGLRGPRLVDIGRGRTEVELVPVTGRTGRAGWCDVLGVDASDGHAFRRAGGG